MEVSLSLHKIMGVINLTPDSFSDGGGLESDDRIIERFNNFIKQNVSIFDIGAESTAPFNNAVSYEQEKNRLMPALNYLKTLNKDSIIISLDTYKPEVALWFFTHLDWDYGIWNDVSGSLDSDVSLFLEKFPNHDYIFCHNNTPSRSETSHHMDYISDICIQRQINSSLELLKKHPFKERIVFDPCFGFSKSYEQNWDLIENWNELFCKDNKLRVVFGVSKKSFMRKRAKLNLGGVSLSSADLLNYSEFLHFDLIKRLMSSSFNETWIRAHDPILVSLALGRSS